MDITSVALAYFIPIGFLLIAWSGLPPARARVAAGNGLMVAGLATVAYVVCGFAFQFGGLGFATSLPGYENLRGMYTPFAAGGPGGGVIGLRGFMLDSSTLTPEVATLFLHRLPLAIMAALIPTLALSGRVRSLLLAVLAVLMAGLVYPLAGHWITGGGWLTNLGAALQLGHGVVDFANAGPVYILGGVVSLVGLILFSPRRAIRPDVPSDLPPSHFPLLASMGALLFGLGWMAWMGSDPLHSADLSLNLPLAMVNGLTAAATAAMVSQGYGWLASSRLDPFMAARGWLAGWIIVSAGAPFIAAWMAFVLGALAGIWLPLGLFAVERLLRREDASASVAVCGVIGLWAVLVPGLLADGRWGAGWNSVGADEYLTVSQQGVTGLLAPAGFIADPGQLTAQAIELAVMVVLALLFAWVVLGVARVLLGSHVLTLTAPASPRREEAEV